jgi:hypothetical protein
LTRRSAWDYSFEINEKPRIATVVSIAPGALELPIYGGNNL